MDAQDRGGLGPERRGVVGQSRAVRRADLHEPGSGLGDDVGDPERPADLDRLPARDDELASARERRGGEQRRGRAVVHRERRLGAGQLAQQRLDVVLARPSRARLEVELEVGVAVGARGDRVARRRRERRAPEVRVHHDAGGVEHAPQRRAQPRPGAVDEVGVVVGAGQQLGAAVGQLGACDRGREAVDGRQRAQSLAAVVGVHARDDPRREGARSHSAAGFAPWANTRKGTWPPASFPYPPRPFSSRQRSRAGSPAARSRRARRPARRTPAA